MGKIPFVDLINDSSRKKKYFIKDVYHYLGQGCMFDYH